MTGDLVIRSSSPQRPRPPQPPVDDARIMMRWWWFGPAITPAEVTRQLTLMQQAGIGGVEVSFVYPLCHDGQIEGLWNLPFLSPAFREVLGFAAREARRLGMRFDLTLGSGWPFGGPHIRGALTAWQLSTQVQDLPAGTTSLPLQLEPGSHLITAIDPQGRKIKASHGHLRWEDPLPADSQTTLLIAGPTGQQVKRAALGAEGPVLDHYSETALQAHLDTVGEVLLEAAGAEQVCAIFTDSLEAYGSNWTPDLLSEFKRRRGYDLSDFLPCLLAATQRREKRAAAETQLIEDVQHDYAQTLTELLHDAFFQPLQRFAHRHGVLSRVQAYGVPPATLASYRHVDLPEGETTLGASQIQQPADWTEITPNRFAASASRYKDHPIVSGETWTRLHSPPYAATPLDMKAEADQFFLQGVNQIVGHGWCHRPEQGDPRQWVFYAAGNFNEVNPWHPVMADLSRYLETAARLLRHGEPVVDVAIYLPDHDVWSRQTLCASKENLHHINALREHIGLELPRELLRCGLNFDLVDDHAVQILSNPARAPLKYRLLILPRIERVPLATLEAMKRLTEGGTRLLVLERAPDQPTGHATRKREEEAVARLSRKLFDSRQTPGARVLHDLKGEQLTTWCPPDVFLEQEAPQIGYAHRRVASGELYFFANTTSQRRRQALQFRQPRLRTYQLCPLSCRATEISPSSLCLEPFGSLFLLQTDQPFREEDWTGFYLRKAEPTQVVETLELQEHWTLLLPDGRQWSLAELEPWTNNPLLLNYAGEALYQRVVDLPPAWIGQPVELFLGEGRPLPPNRRHPDRRNTGARTFLDAPIKDAAEILLNGRRVGALFSPPWRITVGAFLQPGRNLLQIRVWNRLINRLVHQPPHDFSSLHHAFGQRFDRIQDWDALAAQPAGLSGPVELRLLGPS